MTPGLEISHQGQSNGSKAHCMVDGDFESFKLYLRVGRFKSAKEEPKSHKPTPIVNCRLQSRHHAPSGAILGLLLSPLIDSELGEGGAWGKREKAERQKERGEACSPTEHHDCCYSVRGKDFPEKEGEFENNVGNIENCQQPLISISH